MENTMLVSPEETCEVLGVKRSTLFKMLEEGRIPSIKIVGCVVSQSRESGTGYSSKLKNKQEQRNDNDT